MKDVITIQHAQATHHNTGMVGSWTDWELSGLGLSQAQSIGRRLGAQLQGRPCRILSSDLLRARQTAGPLAQVLGVPVELFPQLREHNLGEAVGKSGAWARQNALPTPSFDDPPFPGAEPWRVFWGRVASFCDWTAQQDAPCLILVSHGVTLSVWQSAWLRQEIQPFTYAGLPGGVSFYGVTEGGERVTQRLNDASYMSEARP